MKRLVFVAALLVALVVSVFEAEKRPLSDASNVRFASTAAKARIPAPTVQPKKTIVPKEAPSRAPAVSPASVSPALSDLASLEGAAPVMAASDDWNRELEQIWTVDLGVDRETFARYKKLRAQREIAIKDFVSHHADVMDMKSLKKFNEGYEKVSKTFEVQLVRLLGMPRYFEYRAIRSEARSRFMGAPPLGGYIGYQSTAPAPTPAKPFQILESNPGFFF